jgi:hypothetical protein
VRERELEELRVHEAKPEPPLDLSASLELHAVRAASGASLAWGADRVNDHRGAPVAPGTRAPLAPGARSLDSVLWWLDREATAWIGPTLADFVRWYRDQG